MRTTWFGDKEIQVGDDPNYDYVRDFRRAKKYERQEVVCGACHKPMEPEARMVSPLYGTTGEEYKCGGCGITVMVSPKIEATR